MIAIDSETEAVLGLLDAKIWTRSDEFDTTPLRERALDDKESMRWLAGAARAAERLTDAASVVVVAHRESDIYAGFARRPASIDLIVRAAQDRVLDDGGHLFAAPDAWPELARTEVVSRSRPGVSAQVATVALRTGTVVVCRPRHGDDADGPVRLSMTMVEGARGRLEWRRYAAAMASADHDPDYRRRRCRRNRTPLRLRWRIEEIFRSLKSDGLRLEETQLQDAGRLFKLALIGLAAATHTVQLVDARDGSDRPATDVIDHGLLPAADAIRPTLEGKTPR